MFKYSVRQFSSVGALRANYGFIGLGQMGQHMARHIYEKLDPNDKLYVYDVNGEGCSNTVETIVQAKPANKSLITQLHSIDSFVNKVESPLDYIITMVPEGKHVKAVVAELVENYKAKSSPPVTLLDSSTIDIPTSIEVHQYVKQQLPSFDFIDAPVSGGVAGARKGTLSFMLSRPDYESIATPLNALLQKMGKNIFPCGDKHGTGLAAKLSNNYLLAVTNLAVADSFQLAKSFGLDLNHYAKLVAVSTGKSWASVDNCPIPGVYPDNQLPCDVDYEGGFVTKLTRKDLVLATESAKKNGRFLFLGDLGKYWYDLACEDKKIANKDLAVLYEYLGGIDEEGGNKILGSFKG